MITPGPKVLWRKDCQGPESRNCEEKRPEKQCGDEDFPRLLPANDWTFFPANYEALPAATVTALIT